VWDFDWRFYGFIFPGAPLFPRSGKAGRSVLSPRTEERDRRLEKQEFNLVDRNLRGLNPGPLDTIHSATQASHPFEFNRKIKTTPRLATLRRERRFPPKRPASLPR